jgi:hypothetical protein
LLRKKVRGWSINAESDMRKQKEISEEYNRLDILDETHTLSSLDKGNSSWLGS